ncbi:MAG: crossover junction endodeoxyribonuclease RuvC [Syntrophaceae bacterium]|nr:crossover junction endodeoxyribonuclease RuvC [Syntrophaceae bacterium]
MVIIGVDPGSIITGFGIIEKIGITTKFRGGGIIKTPKTTSQSKRLYALQCQLDEIIKMHGPEIMVVESLFYATNSQSLIKLSQARGVILALGEANGMEVVEYSPLEIKKGLTGYGRADKAQVMFMVSKILGIKDLKSPDQSDAIAMALYHAHIARPKK